MNIRELIENEKLNIENSITSKEKIIKALPEGSLQVHNTGRTYNWYYTSKDNNKISKPNSKFKCSRKYIPKNNRSLAEDLAYKGYLEAQLTDDRKNLKAATSFLNNYVERKSSDKYLLSSVERRDLLESKLHASDKEIEAWLRDVYVGDVPEPNNLRYITQAGFKVRSKSEQIIVALLVKHQIPFKYEQHLLINNHSIYPDFMIMHPKTHKVYVWEHLGMMDNYQYRSRNFDKINDYCVLGFLPGDNLILTYETDKSGIDEILFEKLIRHYFL